VAKKALSPIGDIVKDVFAKIESESAFSREDIDGYWKEFVGETGFKHSRPVDFKKKVLVVRVDSSSWMQELAMQKRKLLKELKRKLGKDTISEIHFKIGSFDAKDSI